MTRLHTALLALLLSGCVSIGSGDPTPLVWYELSPPVADSASANRSAVDPRVLRIDALPASSFYDALAIAFSRAPGQRAYYQYANWTEPVADRLARLVERNVRSGALFADVGPVGVGAPAQLYLRIEVADFFHDAAIDPGAARVAFSAELIDAASRRRIGRREIRASAAVAEADAAGAVAAFEKAVDAAIGELSDWLATVPR